MSTTIPRGRGYSTESENGDPFAGLSRRIQQRYPRLRDSEAKTRFTLSDLCIRTKTKQTVPFAPNSVQAAYLDTLAYPQTALAGRREILLKARQFGFSTLILALLFLDTINTPNTQTVVVAHDADSTERLFQIVQRFYQNLPAETRPATKYANRREFLWPTLDSYFFVGTAGSGQFGRGGTINNVHASEVAFWLHAEELVKGLLEAVPPNGNVFLETTANGLGNWFYEEYQAANRADSVFTPRFFGWHEHEEYREAVPAAFVRTEEEAKLADAYALDDEQLTWRRGKIKALRDSFPQEYPANAQEAFITSGNPYFDRAYLNDLLTALQSAEFDPLTGVDIPACYSRLREAYRRGQLELWETPASGQTYVVSADTAEGLDDDGKHDFDSADALNQTTWTQAAHVHGLWDTHEYGLLLAELGHWYNNALVGVERNNHGHAVLNALIHADRYPNVYYHEEYDEHKKQTSKKPGWPTTPKTKYFALDGLATSLDNRDLHLRSRKTVAELLTFVKLPGGKAGGEGSSHDDAVTALAIGNVLLTKRPRRLQAVRLWNSTSDSSDDT